MASQPTMKIRVGYAEVPLILELTDSDGDACGIAVDHVAAYKRRTMGRGAKLLMKDGGSIEVRESVDEISRKFRELGERVGPESGEAKAEGDPPRRAY